MQKHLSALVVDGEPDIRALLKDFLNPMGFTVFEAGLPRQALSFITEYDFSLVLFEYELPGTNGQRFYREACRLRPELRKRFIFLTCGLPDESMRKGSLCIGKPFDFTLLHETIRQVVQRAAVSPKAAAVSYRALL